MAIDDLGLELCFKCILIVEILLLRGSNGIHIIEKFPMLSSTVTGV